MRLQVAEAFDEARCRAGRGLSKLRRVGTASHADLGQHPGCSRLERREGGCSDAPEEPRHRPMPRVWRVLLARGRQSCGHDRSLACGGGAGAVPAAGEGEGAGPASPFWPCPANGGSGMDGGAVGAGADRGGVLRRPRERPRRDIGPERSLRILAWWRSNDPERGVMSHRSGGSAPRTAARRISEPWRR